VPFLSTGLYRISDINDVINFSGTGRPATDELVSHIHFFNVNMTSPENSTVHKT